MHNFPVTPRYEFPVAASYNMLDVVRDEITDWMYYQYHGSFVNGDYGNFDSVDKIFQFVDRGDGEYMDVTDENIVKGWICRHKLVDAIDEAISTHARYFIQEVSATMKFLPHSGASVTRDGQQFWQSIGEVAMTAPMNQVVIDDEEFICLAMAIGAEELAELYREYVENYA